MLKSTLRQTIIEQQKSLETDETYIPRDIPLESLLQSEEIIDISENGMSVIPVWKWLLKKPTSRYISH